MFDTLIFIMQVFLLPFLCLFIIGLVLLQGGAGDMSSAFGGGGQLDSTLGVGAGRKMSKLTGWMVFFFLAMVTILAIPNASIAKRAARAAEASGAAAPPPTEGQASGTPTPAVSSPEAKPPGEAVQPAPVVPTAEAPAQPVPAPAPAPEQAPVVAPVVAPAPAPAPAPVVAPAPAPSPDKPAPPVEPVPQPTLIPQ